MTGHAPTRTSRGLRVSTVVILILLLLLVGVGWLAEKARDRAAETEAARERAEDVIFFLQHDLRKKLIAGNQLGLAADANQRIIQYLSGLARRKKTPACSPHSRMR